MRRCSVCCCFNRLLSHNKTASTSTPLPHRRSISLHLLPGWPLCVTSVMTSLHGAAGSVCQPRPSPAASGRSSRVRTSADAVFDVCICQTLVPWPKAYSHPRRTGHLSHWTSAGTAADKTLEDCEPADIALSLVRMVSYNVAQVQSSPTCRSVSGQPCRSSRCIDQHCSPWNQSPHRRTAACILKSSP